METFTLGTAIGLNMNATFYADSVNAAAWNKVRLFFFFSWLCFRWLCRVNVFMQIHKINPTEKFPKRPESEYGSRAKQVLAILECFL